MDWRQIYLNPITVTRTVRLTCLFLFVGVHTILSAQDLPTNPSLASQRRAQALLSEGIAALGKRAQLESIETVAWDSAGTSYGLGQAPSFAMQTSASLQNTESAQVDFRRNRLTREVMFQTPGFTFHPRFVIDNGKGYYLNLFSATYGEYDASLAGHRDAFRAVPQLLLKEALDRADTLRSAGLISSNGGRYELLTFVDADQQVVTLYFDAQSKLLHKYEILFEDSIFGDSVSEVIFEDYSRSGAFQVPKRRISRQNGILVANLEYRHMVFNQPLSEDPFQIPSQWEKAEGVQWPWQLTSEPLGKDAYLIRTPNYNVLAIGFSAFTLIVEAPENNRYSGLSAAVLNKVAELLPGKPVKYVTFTHYHYDHGGGIREYIARGTKIVTSPGNVEFLRYIAQVPYTMKPDLQSREPKQAKITLLRNKRYVLSDQTRTAELYDLGPWGHSQEELVVYLPDLHLLFEGDLFASGYGALPAAQDSGFLLARKIKELGLDVQYIVGVHGMKRDIGQLQAALEKRRKRHADDSSISVPAE